MNVVEFICKQGGEYTPSEVYIPINNSTSYSYTIPKDIFCSPLLAVQAYIQKEYNVRLEFVKNTPKDLSESPFDLLVEKIINDNWKEMEYRHSIALNPYNMKLFEDYVSKHYLKNS